ncbi:MAG: haloacid dehalogenase-like hydrolase [Phycisphaerales bacterium]|nr:haloacid dehalogenase-like hydrolase [Phycisphaerales bacterium]
MLILFDIDLTLISTFGSGMLALEQAGKDLFGPSFSIQGVEFAGRLDPLIIDDLLKKNGQALSKEHREAMRRGYATHLGPRLVRPGVSKPLPGVMALLDRVRSRRDVEIGVLTGNFPETGALKLQACGINPAWFNVNAWGNESPHEPPAREHLPPIAMKRYEVRHGRAIDPARVVVIGDTPHDAHCALVNGCRALGVATGLSSIEKLRASGFHRVVENLSATDDIESWLLDGEIAR